MNTPTNNAWDDVRWTPLPPLQRDVRADVCVIGLGGGGLSALRAARDAGLVAVGLDARAVGSGAAGGNGGFLLAGLAVFHHRAVAAIGREHAARLYRATLAEIDRLAAEHGDLVVGTGSLRLADDAREADDCAAQLDAMRSDALPVDTYREGRARGLLFPADAAYQPLAVARREAMALLADGVTLQEGSAALHIAADRVECASGTVRASCVIACVDGGIETLLPELQPRVRSARLQMLATAPVRDRIVPRPVYARWGFDYWQQRADGTLVVGGARDVGANAEWTLSRETSEPVQSALEDIVRERLGVAAPITHRWSAHCAFHAGVLPIIERLGDGVVACGAYNGTGNVMSRLAGRAALALATGREADPALRLFRC